MNTIGIVGVLAFLIISPAICDEDNKSAKEDVTQNPQPYLNSFNNEVNGNWFERQLRAPSGFFGVRGKKNIEDDITDWNLENDFYYPKRAPSGFVGMRGKKYNYNYEPNFSDDYQAELFHQLQKEREMLANLMEEYNNNLDFEKRRPEGFVGLRGKKSIGNDDFFDGVKRVPMGFAGVRGKKSEFPEFVEKRVPIASFFGVRGKKEPSYADNSISSSDDGLQLTGSDGPSQQKRIAGFVGMRG